jgi:hypothetical protein
MPAPGSCQKDTTTATLAEEVQRSRLELQLSGEALKGLSHMRQEVRFYMQPLCLDPAKIPSRFRGSAVKFVEALTGAFSSL